MLLAHECVFRLELCIINNWYLCSQSLLFHLSLWPWDGLLLSPLATQRVSLLCSCESISYHRCVVIGTTVNAIVFVAYGIGNAAGPFMWKKVYQPRFDYYYYIFPMMIINWSFNTSHAHLEIAFHGLSMPSFSEFAPSSFFWFEHTSSGRIKRGMKTLGRRVIITMMYILLISMRKAILFKRKLTEYVYFFYCFRSSETILFTDSFVYLCFTGIPRSHRYPEPWIPLHTLISFFSSWKIYLYALSTISHLRNLSDVVLFLFSEIVVACIDVSDFPVVKRITYTLPFEHIYE